MVLASTEEMTNIGNQSHLQRLSEIVQAIELRKTQEKLRLHLSYE